MKKQDVIEFFDNCAPWWDQDIVRNKDIISTILTLGGIQPGIDVLDVACGTGVLFPDYLNSQVRSVTGIDISPEMAKIAASKFPEVNVICGDVETAEFDKQFDAVMVYNAFPHFPDPAKLIKILAGHTKPGGRLTVAHSMSRVALSNHHKRASKVSIELLHEKELARLFMPFFDVDVMISTDRMYQVSGIRRHPEAHTHGDHTHCHTHDDHHHSHETSDAPMDEMLALLKYMVNHNDAHASELASFAGQLKDIGKIRAYNQIMDTVSDFDVVNARLDAILNELTLDVD